MTTGLRPTRAWTRGLPTAALAASLSLLSLLAAACGPEPVVRVMDGRVVRGRFIDDTAYGAFLLGALAEQGGDLAGARTHYLSATAKDGGDPETWTRLGSVRCRLDPADPTADSDIARALALDPRYEPALAASRVCANLRAGKQAPSDAPTLNETSTAIVVERPLRSTESERREVVALTLLHGDRVTAWEALANWGVMRGDTTLAVRGMIGVARRAPGRRRALARSAIELAGAGHLDAARALSGELIDADSRDNAGGMSRSTGPLPLVARLALDEALIARDLPRIHARSSRTHLGLEVAAGRAWAMGDAALARDLIALTFRADPLNVEARMVHDGAAGRAASRLLVAEPSSLAPDVAMPFARELVRSESVAAAHRALSLRSRGQDIAGDPVLTPIAVELVIAGALEDDELSASARIELVARRGAVPSESLVADPTLDARHRLLGLALIHPGDPGTLAEANRMAPAASEDLLVAAALARIALARREPLVGEVRRFLESAVSTDPIAAAVVVDLARSDGPPAALAQARAQLAALARTPAERAHATE